MLQTKKSQVDLALNIFHQIHLILMPTQNQVVAQLPLKKVSATTMMKWLITRWPYYFQRNMKNHNDTFKKSIRNQLEVVIQKRKEKSNLFKNFSNTERNQITTNSDSESRKSWRKYPDGMEIFIMDSVLYGVTQKRLGRKEVTVNVHNFWVAIVDSMKHHVAPIISKRSIWHHLTSRENLDINIF